MIATILVLKPTVFTKVKENLGIRIAKCFRVLETLNRREKGCEWSTEAVCVVGEC